MIGCPSRVEGEKNALVTPRLMHVLSKCANTRLCTPGSAHLPLAQCHELGLKQDVRHVEIFISLDFKYLNYSKRSINVN